MPAWPDDRRYAVDSSKLTRLTGCLPAVTLEDGIRETVTWFQRNESWWRPIKTGERVRVVAVEGNVLVVERVV